MARISLLRLALSLAVLAGLGATGAAAPSFHVCAAGDPAFLGTFALDGDNDGADKFTNEGGKSVYRHAGYWYTGDLASCGSRQLRLSCGLAPFLSTTHCHLYPNGTRTTASGSS